MNETLSFLRDFIKHAELLARIRPVPGRECPLTAEDRQALERLENAVYSLGLTTRFGVGGIGRLIHDAFDHDFEPTSLRDIGDLLDFLSAFEVVLHDADIALQNIKSVTAAA